MSEPTASPAVSGARGGADAVFAYLAVLLVLGVVVQFFLAGLGVFDIAGHQDLDKVKGLDPHRAVGHILAAISLLMFIAALIARTGKAKIWVSLALVVLIEGVQVALASGGTDHHWLGGLHALNGVIILGLAGWTHRISRSHISFMNR